MKRFDLCKCEFNIKRATDEDGKEKLDFCKYY